MAGELFAMVRGFPASMIVTFDNYLDCLRQVHDHTQNPSGHLVTKTAASQMEAHAHLLRSIDASVHVAVRNAAARANPYMLPERLPDGYGTLAFYQFLQRYHAVEAARTPFRADDDQIVTPTYEDPPDGWDDQLVEDPP